MQTSREKVLREADFHKRAVSYRVWATIIPLAVTLILIPVLPVIVPFLIWYQRRHYQRLRVVLTTRDLKIHRGVWVREEKSIPLEKITDLRVFQGPLMRYFDVTGLAVETAGQATGGALATVYGIIDTEDFRDRVLAQRDRIADAEDNDSSAPAARPSETPTDAGTIALLTEIRDSLQRIEQRWK
ncbi:MAG: PH domain-containing protein [Wenzhouxiangella sp.]|jgi:putative membrane protein|nr:PH domain-containing protein [Wenzhouxiangella sp.]